MLIKDLESVRGNGRCMISLIIPPGDEISRVTKVLAEEHASALNIKNSVNRQSVLEAITSAQEKIYLYNEVPRNGLVIYTGTIMSDDGKEKMVAVMFEPFMPINVTALFVRDNKFHTESVREVLVPDKNFGTLSVNTRESLPARELLEPDKNFGTLSVNTRESLPARELLEPDKNFGTLSGNTREVPALWFARSRMERRKKIYIEKTAEMAKQCFINPDTSLPNVSGSADFKIELKESEIVDPRPQTKILNVVDVSDGGECGFNQEIELSGEKFIPEKKSIEILFIQEGGENDKNMQRCEVKILIKELQSVRGNGRCMISLIIPPGDQISRVKNVLDEEHGTALSIKVLEAITSAQEKLKLYKEVPRNGLVIYTGTIMRDDGEEKKVAVVIEPFRPINIAALFVRDDKFHVESLGELLDPEEIVGFIIMDRNGILFGTLKGSTREVVHKFTIDLPKKHLTGGQSALRFARLRMENRNYYIKKTAEMATQYFINPNTSLPNVSGLILAGSGDFKIELSQCDMFDSRLQTKILNVVDVSYGGETGFNQAIELSGEFFGNVKFVKEKKLIGKLFKEISEGTGKYVYGVDDTIRALKMGAVETLVLWESLDLNRFELRNSVTGEVVIKHLNKEEADLETSGEFEVVKKMPLLEWFDEKYLQFGCSLEYVTNQSLEGSQFCRGFGGVGGVLRYRIDLRMFDEASDDEGVDEDSE